MKKIVILVIIVAICGGLTAWDLSQQQAIRDETVQVPIVYEAYTPDCPDNEVREAKFVALYQVVEVIEYERGSSIASGTPVADYYLAKLENGDTGLIELDKEEIPFYQEIICTSEEEFLSKKGQPLLVRGRTSTRPMSNPLFNSPVSGDMATREYLNTLTLLMRGEYPDTETIVPEKETLGGYRVVVFWGLGICGVLLLVEVFTLLRRKSIERAAKKLFGSGNEE